MSGVPHPASLTALLKRNPTITKRIETSLINKGSGEMKDADAEQRSSTHLIVSV